MACKLNCSSNSFYLNQNKSVSPNKKGSSPQKERIDSQTNPNVCTLKNKPMRNTLVMHNHFEHNEFLGNKKALYYGMKKYYSSVNENVFDFLPLTFHVHSTEDSDEQFADFKEKYNEELEKNKRKRLWILKPGENTNRGKGITIHSDIDEIMNLINSTIGEKKEGEPVGSDTPAVQNPTNNKTDEKNSKRTFIIQSYI